MPDPTAVNSMFGRIAHRYDAANAILSGGADRWWRRRLVSRVRRQQPRHVLDLATGSGDVAFALGRALPPDTAITGMDFCQPMLDQAEAKKRAAGTGAFANLRFVPGDGLALPLPDESQEAVTIAFGLRNLADRPRGLREMRRVLRPGGRLYVLEFSQPYPWFRPVYYAYLRWLLPRIAGMVTGDRAAYVYLNDTIGEFPDRAALAREIAAAGFDEVRATALTLGIVALHEARR
ncbi:MAG: ubiquinone/menaquinone biosynthesis methyltransferase [Verrucomicrobia bacterium]|nr:ubiquinone/menaquinone biosynthesis methyltransferase [Verrucomicrobiota bacterium]